MHDRLNELRPFVTGLRFVKDMSVVDVILRSGWDVYESDLVTYKPSQQNENYFMFHPKDSTDSDFNVVLDHVEDIIKKNIEKEQKLVLLKAKIEELKMLFSSKPLNELERLKFKIEDIDEPKLEDISSKIKDEPIFKNGVELPPNGSQKEEEKEEV